MMSGLRLGGWDLGGMWRNLGEMVGVGGVGEGEGEGIERINRQDISASR